jgi:hypothetical protein
MTVDMVVDTIAVTEEAAAVATGEERGRERTINMI